MGQITFDEVELLTDELCSGFPHLISAPFGKLYLWKGRGAGADELGCARLIGMDLGLTGEIEEVDEGKESAAFWGVFSSKYRLPNTSSTGVGATDKWNKKASCENYITRLFSIDLETPRPKSSASIGGSVSGFGRWVRQGSIPNLSHRHQNLKRRIPWRRSEKYHLSRKMTWLLEASTYLTPSSNYTCRFPIP